MRLLIDQPIASRTAERLRELGYDAVSALELGMNRSPDELIIEFAVAHSRIIATLDSDYHRMIAVNSMLEPSTILLREKEPPSKLATALIHQACTRYERELLTGCLLTCSTKYTRLRALPIRKD